MSDQKPTSTVELYNAIMAAWLETPSVRYVARMLDLSGDFVTAVRDNGMPELGLPPLPRDGTKVPKRNGVGKGGARKNGGSSGGFHPPVTTDDAMTLQAEIVIAREEASRYGAQVRDYLAELEARARRLGIRADVAEARAQVDGTLAAVEAAEATIRLQEHRISTVSESAIKADVIKRSADETVASHMLMNNCGTICEIMGAIADNLLEGIRAGAIELPKVADPRVLASLAVSAEKIAHAMDTALKIKKGRGGEIEKSTGATVGVLMEQCTPAELAEIKMTGRLPARLKVLSADVD